MWKHITMFLDSETKKHKLNNLYVNFAFNGAEHLMYLHYYFKKTHDVVW
jgi:hypothetical protein